MIDGPLRIGLYHSTLPERRRKPGGVEQHVHRLANQLQRRGHSVVVASFVRTPDDALYSWHRLRPEVVGRSQAGRVIGAPVLLNRRWRAAVDVLHLHGDDWFFLVRDVPTVRTFHGSARCEAVTAEGVLRRLSQRVMYPLERWSARLATGAYVVGSGELAGYRSRGPLNLGINLPDLTISRRRTPHPTILFVGTWAGRKRGRFLHAVFQDVIRPAVPNAELWMVSDACEGSVGVTHFPAPDDETLNRLYQQAWLFCLPSTYEGFGIPYLEAMANGTPVVSTPNSGASYLTRNGDAGVLVSDSELGSAVIELLGSADARDRLAEQGRAVAHEFSWDAAISTHEDAYRTAIAEFRGLRADAGRI